MKYFSKIAILLLLFHSDLFSQPQRTISIKIESNNPTHLYSNSHTPKFDLKIEARRTVKGKFYVFYKSITETKYKLLNEEIIKLNRGTKLLKIEPKIHWKPGFYELFARVVTGDYEYISDTLTFAYKTDSIFYAPTKPYDFDLFWKNTFCAAETVSKEYAMIEMSEKNTDLVRVYKLIYLSVNDIIIKGWYCLPQKEGRIPSSYYCQVMEIQT